MNSSPAPQAHISNLTLSSNMFDHKLLIMPQVDITRTTQSSLMLLIFTFMLMKIENTTLFFSAV